MRNRSIRKNKFNLPSMRQLWMKLGEYDAIVEYVECMRRFFWESYKSAEEKEGIIFKNYLHKQAQIVGVNIGAIDALKYEQDIIKWYLIYPYKCLNQFVSNFVRDLEIFGLQFEISNKDGDAFSCLLKELRKKGVLISVEQIKIDLIDYYRLNRNFSAHTPKKGDINKMQNKYEIVKSLSFRQLYPNLKNALVSTDQLHFDDFTLCTANIKNVADTLTTDIYSCITSNIDNYDIVSDFPHIKKVRKFVNNKRAINMISNTFASKYGVQLSDEICNSLLNRINV